MQSIRTLSPVVSQYPEEPKQVVYRFAEFELSSLPIRLRLNGAEVKVRPQALRVLEMLLRHTGNTVTAGQLKGQIWPGRDHGSFKSAVRIAVVHLRKALGDQAQMPLYVETVPRIGYRFVHPVMVTESLLVRRKQLDRTSF